MSNWGGGVARLGHVCEDVVARIVTRCGFRGTVLASSERQRKCGVKGRVDEEMKGSVMGTREKEILSKLFAALLPVMLTTAVRVVEEVVRADLNNDGNVGFGESND